MKAMDILPPWKLFVTPQIGGILVIAYDGDMPVAFGSLTRAIEKGLKTPYLYLDMLGVLPKYQGHKLGEEILKKTQAYAKKEELSNIKWTYDPLEGANGNLYIRKLGATVSQYYEDYYGRLSGKHAGSATDRFWTELKNDASSSDEYANAEVVVTQQTYKDYDEVIKNLPNTIAVEIPNDFNAIKVSNPKKAELIRLSTRHIFKDLFAKNYQIRGFERKKNKNYYVAVLLPTQKCQMLD